MGRSKLTDVTGLGKRYAGRLRLAGLGSLQKLAAASVDDLASVKGVARERAALFIESARAILGASPRAPAPAEPEAKKKNKKDRKKGKGKKRRKKKRPDRKRGKPGKNKKKGKERKKKKKNKK